MNKRKWIYRVGNKSISVVAALALMVTTLAMNRTCMWYLGQDEMPDGAARLRKF